ncbi:uncharacterized protein LOC126682443 [Mercurialis annua]|uniref:uncharacterized protein LOC126682443 n=1 Tax=Mercurialis annua TaxID=3986 RepID=UPI00215E7766|nr:uncharacterized protein LOC126682443 [Mercurialis annua]XP_050234100.1 uncharacterized protein LOC126682443 [Mercurialis annua]XP_050234101.1 uncharacterized protein LOC126682443 [Mercurialis annua]
MKANSGIAQKEKFSTVSVFSGSSDYKCNEQEETASLPELRELEVVSLEPHLVDVCNRSCCRPRRNLCPFKGDICNILPSLLGKDDLEYQLDVNTSHFGLLSFSPPLRTKNPLVCDVTFVHQNLEKNSVLGNTVGEIDHRSGAKVHRHGNYERKPIIRIEGFDSKDSKSN